MRFTLSESAGVISKSAARRSLLKYSSAICGLARKASSGF